MASASSRTHWRSLGAAAVALAALTSRWAGDDFGSHLRHGAAFTLAGRHRDPPGTRTLMRNEVPGSSPLLPRNQMVQGPKPVRWWEEQSKEFSDRMKVEESIDSIERLRRQMTAEEAAFDQEIEDIVIAGKRALLRLRMQKAVETPGMKTHLFKVIKKMIARALTLRREREIARGITREQSRRIKRRRRLELKMEYEAAYGGERPGPKSRKWLRRMGRII